MFSLPSVSAETLVRISYTLASRAAHEDSFADRVLEAH